MKYILAALLFYPLWFITYFVCEKFSKNKKDKKPTQPREDKKVKHKDDIIGKSLFRLENSMTETAIEKPNSIMEVPNTTSVEEKEKEISNTDTFASNDETVVPDEEENNLMDIDYPLEEIEEDEDFEIDSEDEKLPSGIISKEYATGISFEEMKTAITVVTSIENSNQEEQKEAGRILCGIEDSDLLKKVCNTKERVDVVSQLMNLHLSEYHKELDHNENNSIREVPEDFSIESIV